MRDQTFSERMGIVKPREVQLHDMDERLRNGLWNALMRFEQALRPAFHIVQALQFHIWTNCLKFKADEMPDHPSIATMHIKRWFFDKNTSWHQVYAILEMVGQIGADSPYGNEEYIRREHLPVYEDALNGELESENAGYRYIGGKFAPITNPQEVQAVESALLTPFNTVSIHLQKALDHLSDRMNPDYRNSIKESISAIESLCKCICVPIAPQMESATLGTLLEKTTKELDLNDDLRDGFKKIYDYTSDDHGVRHGLKNEDQPEQEDARFFLIACSAFANYITEKARKKGLL